MGPFFESIWIALQSIWANKLRSFLTLLGNIVAVTSIVTVVSLIQGLNATVSGAIVGRVGGDAFVVQRTPLVRTQDDEERTRSFPLITLKEADAIRAFSPAVQAVLARTQNRGTISYRTQELQSVQVQGVTSEYQSFSNFDAERGRLMSAVEVDRNQFVALLGWDVADQLFGDINPLEKTITISGTPFRVVGVSARKGSLFGNSQDTFVVIPLGSYMRVFGTRQSLALMVKPTSPEALKTAIEDTTLALRVSRHLKPAERDNFGLFTSDTVIGIYQQATNGIFAVLVGVVALSLLVTADRPPPGFVGLIGGTAEWVFVKPGHVSVTISAANRMVNQDAETIACAVWPDVQAALELPKGPLPPWRVVKERRATVAATAAQERLRPGPRTRFANVVLAGDWTDTGLPGTIEGAIRSGQTAAEVLLAA